MSSAQIFHRLATVASHTVMLRKTLWGAALRVIASFLQHAKKAFDMGVYIAIHGDQNPRTGTLYPPSV
jgi:hypothetical protein